jgi:aldose 1-epimerase
MASFTLAPFSNRIPGGRFQFQGQTYQLRPNTPNGNAQHGDVRRRPWTLGDFSTTQAECALDTSDFPDFNYPFPFTCVIRYSLDGPCLETEFRLTNAGDAAMPAGFGFHPYFQRTLVDPLERVELEARTGGVYEGLMPTTPAVPVPPELDFSWRRPLAEAVLNHCFAEWNGRAIIRWPASGVTAALEAEAPLRHLVLFAPEDQPFLAVEPVTNATNGFNLYAAGHPGTGTLVLEPGESASARFQIRLES